MMKKRVVALTTAAVMALGILRRQGRRTVR